MCLPVMIDLLILVDTTSDLTNGVKYKPRVTLNILKYLIRSYHIGLWDTHIGIGTWNGREIETELKPDEYGTTPGDMKGQDQMIARIEEFYPTSDDNDDPLYQSFKSSPIKVIDQKPITFQRIREWKANDMIGTFRDGVKTVTAIWKTVP